MPKSSEPITEEQRSTSTSLPPSSLRLVAVLRDSTQGSTTPMITAWAGQMLCNHGHRAALAAFFFERLSALLDRAALERRPSPPGSARRGAGTACGPCTCSTANQEKECVATTSMDTQGETHVKTHLVRQIPIGVWSLELKYNWIDLM